VFLDQPLNALGQSLIARGVRHAARIARADPTLNSTPERLHNVWHRVRAHNEAFPSDEQNKTRVTFYFGQNVEPPETEAEEPDTEGEEQSS
jgi:hypothetical protein